MNGNASYKSISTDLSPHQLTRLVSPVLENQNTNSNSDDIGIHSNSGSGMIQKSNS